MSKTTKYNTCLTIQQAMKRAIAGVTIGNIDWPENRHMIFNPLVKHFEVWQDGKIMYCFLKSADFSHQDVIAYMGNRFYVVDKTQKK